MRYTLAIMVLMQLAQPALASDVVLRGGSSENETQHAKQINTAAHMTALIHTDRDKRAKKFLWLKPGKIIKWHYEWVMPDGSTVTKVEDHKLADVYDRRCLKETNPNAAIALPILQAVLNTGMNTVTAMRH